MVLLTKYHRQQIKSPIYVKPTLMIISVVNCIFFCIFFSKIVSTPSIVSEIKGGNALDPDYYQLLQPSFNSVDTCLKFSYVALGINIVLGVKYGIRTAIKLAS